jgi:hypothetical protein
VRWLLRRAALALGAWPPPEALTTDQAAAPVLSGWYASREVPRPYDWEADGGG